jgi:hypothetical protein
MEVIEPVELVELVVVMGFLGGSWTDYRPSGDALERFRHARKPRFSGDRSAAAGKGTARRKRKGAPRLPSESGGFRKGQARRARMRRRRRGAAASRAARAGVSPAAA